MIVDDHPAFRQMVKTLLDRPGSEFLECQSGEEAVNAYSVFRPHIVLMDIAMKGMSGLTATGQIAADYPDARILILTQYDDPDLRSAARDAGAAGYLLKEDLSQTLVALCNEMAICQRPAPPRDEAAI